MTDEQSKNEKDRRSVAYDTTPGRERVVTSPLSDEAEQVLKDFIISHREELDEKLKPLGVEIALIAAKYSRAYWDDDERVPGVIEKMHQPTKVKAIARYEDGREEVLEEFEINP